MNSTNLLDIPQEVILQIFSYLKPDSLQSLLLTCSQIYNIIESHLWKSLSLRDYLHFLCQTPLRIEETNLYDFKSRLEQKEEAQKIISDPFKEPLSKDDLKKIEQAQSQIINWKSFYIDCYQKEKMNLTGFWVGDYGDHGFELIRIFHKGYHVYAKKLTGDPNIPAGKLTWKAMLDKNLKNGKGEIHLADTGFQNPRWNTALLENVTPDIIKISWQMKGFGSFGYCFTFYMIKAGKGEYDLDTMGRKFQTFVGIESDEQDHYLA